MSKFMFPKSKELLDAELEAWKTVLQAIEDLRTRVDKLEKKLAE